MYHARLQFKLLSTFSAPSQTDTPYCLVSLVHYAPISRLQFRVSLSASILEGIAEATSTIKLMRSIHPASHEDAADTHQQKMFRWQEAPQPAFPMRGLCMPNRLNHGLRRETGRSCRIVFGRQVRQMPLDSPALHYKPRRWPISSCLHRIGTS
jgi:hypothetical protein